MAPRERPLRRALGALCAAFLAASPATAALAEEEGPRLELSAVCALCHSNAPTAEAMRDAAGRPIAPFDLWSGSMMANSARDPLWRAAVSAEVHDRPHERATIEADCMRCHAPMAHRSGLDPHETESVMHLLDCPSRAGLLAQDGVSCSLCHGITPGGLGSERTFSGRFELDRAGRLFGPHAEPFVNPMLRISGFRPTYGPHVGEAALCGSCHTLETEVLDEQGRPTGARFLEQAPYLEWRNSLYDEERDPPAARAAACAACHVPRFDVEGHALTTRIGRNPAGRDFPPTIARSPFGRHLFVGGNVLVPALLRDHAEELGVTAPREALEATLAATRAQLARSARVTIEEARRTEEGLAFAVRVENRAGHKLPTGHPSRRAWLRVHVRGEDGSALLASGRTDARGRILGADGEPLPSERAGGPHVPHRDLVRSADELASFEAVMADARGAPTFLLSRAARWLVDDRLLPAGWTQAGPFAERTAPVGLAGDVDFVGGSDRVRFELALEARGPLSVEVELVYQPLGARYEAELLAHPTPEVERLARLLEGAEREPVVLAADRASL